ncbi:hypothetical protein [Thermomonospora cellulosilytica]|uniref:Uncharacterized protein n=1 Tax=Thermomonospora cellulosilytica TaxID=1411118 RepID=A0A7W3R8M8_9ACTN|nr:hypothetical protein [Thermomonospora cellulosilytica]MBA9003764.1 hypothetical protein [Thermomonospora cellulosilytica]
MTGPAGRVLLLEAERMRPVPSGSTARLIRQTIAILAQAMADRELAPRAPAAGKADRVEDYAWLRANNVGPDEAAARVGVSAGTGRRHEHEIKENPKC